METQEIFVGPVTFKRYVSMLSVDIQKTVDLMVQTISKNRSAPILHPYMAYAAHINQQQTRLKKTQKIFALLPHISELRIQTIQWNEGSLVQNSTTFLSQLSKINLPILTSLKISSNSQNPRIDNIPQFIYSKNIKNLKQIAFFNNNVTFIDNLLVLPISNVQILNFGHNKINCLYNLCTFHVYEKLRVLDVSNNMIQSVEMIERLEASCLEEFYLSSNKLTTIRSLTKMNLPSLKKLKLLYNFINDFTALQRLSNKQINILFVKTAVTLYLEPQLYVVAKFPSEYACDYCAGDFDYSQISAGFLLGGHIPESTRLMILRCSSNVRNIFTKNGFKQIDDKN